MEQVVIDTSRFGQRASEGVDEYGNQYQMIRGEWIKKPKTDYDIALEELDREFPGVRITC
jgi:aspartate aminotransferase-like enzyme